MTLVPTASAGWSTGFANLFDKELASWWRTRRWLVHLLLWQVAITSFVLMGTLSQYQESRNPAGDVAELMDMFFQLGAFFGLIGAVLVTQGAIVGERNSGTAAWVLTKPTTRKAFVLSKFAAITPTFLLLSLLLPSVAAFVICRIFWGPAPTLAHFSEAVGLLAVHQSFYVALTLMLGTLFRSRGPVGGIALGFWIAGMILPNLHMFQPLTPFMPWPLARAAASIAVWQPFQIALWIPTLSTLALTLVFLGVALLRFEREEF